MTHDEKKQDDVHGFSIFFVSLHGLSKHQQ